jgi:hypothetical protein
LNRSQIKSQSTLGVEDLLGLLECNTDPMRQAAAGVGQHRLVQTPGPPVTLEELVAAGPAVIVFYRGD